MKIGVFGLGYVGFPLAVELSRLYQVCGFDLNMLHILDESKLLVVTQELIKIIIK